MARPTKLTRKVQNTICRAIRAGLTLSRAAQAAGIHYDTLNEWRKQGNADMAAGHANVFSEFAEALNQAEIDAELKHAEIIARAARGGARVTEIRKYTKAEIPKGSTETGKVEPVLVEETTTTTVKTALPDWRASAFILERRHPDRWGQKQQLDLKHSGAIAFTADEAAKAENELRQWEQETFSDQETN